MKKLLFTIIALTLGLSIIPVHGAERKRKAEENSVEGRAAKKQRHDLTKKLSAAIIAYNIEEVINLLNHGADPNIMYVTNRYNMTSNINPMRYFLVYDERPVDHRLSNGMLIGNAQTAIIIALVKHGLDVDESDGIPLLVLSAYRGKTHITQTLIDLGADVNQPITHHRGIWHSATIGMTPLMAASTQGNIDDLKILLDSGANPEPVDADGNDIPYHLDKKYSERMMTNEKRQEILKIIEPYKKAYREAMEKASKNLEQKTAKRQAANMDERKD